VQAQEVRAAGLALRCRVPGLVQADVDGAALVRTWTVRGTVHLVAERDRAWLHAACAPTFRRRFETLVVKRGGLDAFRALLPDLLDVLAAGPTTRANALAGLAARGHPEVAGPGVNVLIPWASQLGVVVSLPDGRLRACDPPAAVDADEAFATLVHRYLAGYGPAKEADLARWSGLPLGALRRGLAAIEPLERAGDLLALPGALDAEVPPAPDVRLLAAFDTLLLGWRRREVVVPAGHERAVVPGGGVVRAAVLARGVAAGTWRLAGSGRKRAFVAEWFAQRPDDASLAAEVEDVARFLAVRI
jgi:hypothetical protein